MHFKERYKYHLQNDLAGKGGFTRVYRATDTLYNRTVTLKFFAKEPEKKHALIKEINKVIQLVHPNLCRYYDIIIIDNSNLHGEIDNIEVGVMEYLERGYIKTYLKQHPEQIDKLHIDVLEGISFLHQHAIIHHDFRSRNILIKNSGSGAVAKMLLWYAGMY